MIFPTRVLRVAIGAVNTLVLTDSGNLFIYGSDEYGQSGRTEEEKQEWLSEFNSKKNNENHILEMLSTPIPIKIPSDKNIKIKDIAMGSHHILALSAYYEIFSWGRNDEGQLGLGYISRPVETPKIIENMLRERIKAVYASENFSA